MIRLARALPVAGLAFGLGLAAPAASLNRLLVANATVVTLAPGGEDPFSGYIVVGADGRITQVGPGAPPADLEAELVFDARGKVALPGFVSARSRLAGRGDAALVTLQGSIDLLRGGVTTARLDPPEPAAAATPAPVVWSPLTDGRLGAPLLDVPGLLKAGRMVGFGLDVRRGADVADAFENMRVGLYALRFRDRDPRGLQPLDLLRLHTSGSARVLGLADEVGTLEVGKAGDLILVDPHWPDTGPVIDLYATLVLACDRLNIASVFIAGRHVMQQGRLTVPDFAGLRLGRETP